MIGAGWRRLGISPAALVVAAMTGVAFVLSRSAGAGWLVVIAAALASVLVFAALWSAVGLIGLRLSLELPTDATVGDTLPLRMTVASPVGQLRLVHLRGLDHSSHVAVGAGTGTLSVRATRRQMVSELTVEVQAGFPLGLITGRRRFHFRPETALAVGPAAAPVSLLQALGGDDGASVRTVRPYVRGDAPRLVHWRSSARRGELMVREFESADPLRGIRLCLRVDLRGDPDAAESIASEAAGLAYAALDAGISVELLTAEAAGPLTGPVRSRRDVDRRLAAAVAGPLPAPGTAAGRVIELRAEGSG